MAAPSVAAAAAVRPVIKILKGRMLMEGAGVRICRTVGEARRRRAGSLRRLSLIGEPSANQPLAAPPACRRPSKQA
jgi:hypothetical protein